MMDPNAIRNINSMTNTNSAKDANSSQSANAAQNTNAAKDKDSDKNANSAASTNSVIGEKDDDNQITVLRNPGESTQKKPGKKSSPAECETCKNRKYQDGSDEMVSYKVASHISPSASAAQVRGHEQEHVNNAYKKAAEMDGKVVACSVILKTAICPECGRTYVSGGVTNTQIRYYNDSNPYQQEMKSSDAANKYQGMNVDVAG